MNNFVIIGFIKSYTFDNDSATITIEINNNNLEVECDISCFNKLKKYIKKNSYIAVKGLIISSEEKIKLISNRMTILETK